MKTVHWKNRVTNETGHRLPLHDADAERWATLQNRKHPDIDYWTEPVEDGDES